MPISAVIFLTCFVIGCVLAVVRHPIYGLLTYIATLYLDPVGQWWGHGTLPNLRWELVPAAITLVMMLVYRRRVPSPVFRSGVFRGFVVFVIWLIIQYPWALDQAAQGELLSIWGKFLLVSIMICGCVDSWENLRLVLWTHVLGCVYMGWSAYNFYHGGRFQGFGLGSLAEANAGALQLVTGFIAAASLFLAGGWRAKAILVVSMGFIADGIITTESRSGFLSILGAGIAFIAFTPKAFRLRVIVISIVGAACFVFLTTSSFWNRMNTIQDAGAAMPGVDTGHERLVVIKAQWRMFQEHPLGCGSACTEVLSPKFLAAKYLARGYGKRASHNTFMTMLVEQGIPGVAMYVALLLWMFRKLRSVFRETISLKGLPATLFPGLVGIMVAITIGDMFAQYPKFEARVWFVSLIIAYAQLLQLARRASPEAANFRGQLEVHAV